MSLEIPIDKTGADIRDAAVCKLPRPRATS